MKIYKYTHPPCIASIPLLLMFLISFILPSNKLDVTKDYRPADLFNIQLHIMKPKENTESQDYYLVLSVFSAPKGSYIVTSNNSKYSTFSVHFTPEETLLGYYVSKFPDYDDLTSFMVNYTQGGSTESIDLLSDKNWESFTNQLYDSNLEFRKLDLSNPPKSSPTLREQAFHINFESKPDKDDLIFKFNINFPIPRGLSKASLYGLQMEKRGYTRSWDYKLIKSNWVASDFDKFKNYLQKEEGGRGQKPKVDNPNEPPKISDDKNTPVTSRKNDWSIWYTIGIIGIGLLVFVLIGGIIVARKLRMKKIYRRRRRAQEAEDEEKKILD